MWSFVAFFITLFVFGAQAFAFSSKIDEITPEFAKEMQKAGTYSDGCPVSIDRLRQITFDYYDFNKNVQHDGRIVVMDAVAENVVAIFKKLFELNFPISESRNIEYYAGNEELSLAANNTACFNCRPIIGSSTLSLHAYGLAIDINPVQNPFVAFSKNATGEATILPKAGFSYLNRANVRPGMIEEVVAVFRENGFTIWGGNWNTPIDWQHFQVPRIVAKIMATMQAQDAKEFFQLYIKDSKLFDDFDPKDENIIYLYNKDPIRLMFLLRSNFIKLNLMEPSEAVCFLQHNF